jgi:hypothetical protein
MFQEFKKICLEVDAATKFLHSIEECRPHYQRVLDYIIAHPDERDSFAIALSNASSQTGKPGTVRADIYLLEFLMETLHWPEVKRAAEACEGNSGHTNALLKVFESK